MTLAMLLCSGCQANNDAIDIVAITTDIIVVIIVYFLLFLVHIGQIASDDVLWPMAPSCLLLNFSPEQDQPKSVSTT